MPTEWDEADLAFRIREAGWKVATCGYERLGGYDHLGSTTIGELCAAYRTRARERPAVSLAVGRVIARDHARPRRTWMRRASLTGWANTGWRIVARAGRKE